MLHPEVLERFEIKFPSAAVEIDVECLLELAQYNRAGVEVRGIIYLGGRER